MRNFTFCGGREQKATTFFVFFWPLIESFRIQLQQKNCQDFTNWARWNKRDKVWSSATSLFKQRFCRRRRCCCLNSLTTSLDFKQKFLWRTALKSDYEPDGFPGAKISTVTGTPLTSVGTHSTVSFPLIFIISCVEGSMALKVIGELPLVGLVKLIMKPFLTWNPCGGLLSLGIMTMFLPDLFKIFSDT